MSQKQRLEQLKAYVRICFALIAEEDPKEVANKTGLSLSTIHRLASEDFSLDIRFRTYQSLGLAAGVEITIKPHSITMNLS